MADLSTYLRLLPPVLWEDEPPPPAFSLGTALRIFEKLLTGIEDGLPITHVGADGVAHEHRGLEKSISLLFRLYSPWTVPLPFLDWLGSWVALEFDPIWDEYQRRKLLSQMVQIYHRRGLKEGLDIFLEIHTVTQTRPRIAVDDCSKLLFSEPRRNKLAPLYTMVSQMPLQRPLCLALAPDGSFFLGDDGAPGPSADQFFWRLPAPGEYHYGGAPPIAQPLALPPLIHPIAVAVDGTALSYNAYTLDQPVIAGNALWRLPSGSGFTPTLLATKAQLFVNWPVAMVAHPSNHNLYILDRGANIGDIDSPTPAIPRIIEVQNAQAGPPVTAVTHSLSGITEPFSLLALPDGTFIVGDAAQQDTSNPADLIHVDPANGWSTTSLLGAVPSGQNPLVAPKALVRVSATELLVVDIGLRPYRNGLASLFEKIIAEQSAVYRVDLSTSPPTITRASEIKQLVWPSGAAWDGKTLYVSDRGEYADLSESGPFTRSWRSQTNEFGVVVHFSSQRPTTQPQRRQIIGNVAGIVEQEKPAHSRWTMAFSV